MIALFNENASPIVWLDPFYLRGGAIHRHRLVYAYYINHHETRVSMCSDFNKILQYGTFTENG